MWAVEVILSQLENAAYACHLSVQLSSTSGKSKILAAGRAYNRIAREQGHFEIPDISVGAIVPLSLTTYWKSPHNLTVLSTMPYNVYAYAWQPQIDRL